MVARARRRGRPAAVLALSVLALSLLVAACSSSSTSPGATPGTTGNGTNNGTVTTNGTATGPTTSVDPNGPQEVTPVVARVPVAPIPFPGSDDATHLVYELFLTNAGRSAATVEQIEVVDPTTDRVVATLGREQIDARFTLANGGSSAGTLEPAQSGVLYVHLAIEDDTNVPDALVHRTTVRTPDAVDGSGRATADIAAVTVDRQPVIELGPPLRGSGFIAADACCDAQRHRRALLPINGTQSIAQRYAVDWEQLDDQGRIYAGEQTDPTSYAIYGDEVLAVADATVVHTVDGLPEQVPGTPPASIPISEADGNSVILDLGGGRWVMYAHLQPGSVRVKAGDRVKKGEVVGLVGNSGNSIAPHLHVHVMSSPLPLAAEGLPYTIDRFTVSGRAVSTAAFDRAEAEGTPLEYDRVDPPTEHRDQYPMDQSIVTFSP